MSDDREIWNGEQTEPRRLADQIAEAPSEILRLPLVTPLRTVTLSMSDANRDLVVRALRAYRSH